MYSCLSRGHNFSRVGNNRTAWNIIIIIIMVHFERPIESGAYNECWTGIAGVMMCNYKTHVLSATFLESRFRPNVFLVHDSRHSPPWNV